MWFPSHRLFPRFAHQLGWPANYLMHGSFFCTSYLQWTSSQAPFQVYNTPSQVWLLLPKLVLPWCPCHPYIPTLAIKGEKKGRHRVGNLRKEERKGSLVLWLELVQKRGLAFVWRRAKHTVSVLEGSGWCFVWLKEKGERAICLAPKYKGPRARRLFLFWSSK